MSFFKKLSKTSLPLYIVDAFTKKPFRGNSAGVCLLPFHEVLSKETKQKIAAELKHSATAFISTQSRQDSFESGNRFGLEWFTPTCELNLCGHGTLASTAVLASIFNNKSEVIKFETVNGILNAKCLADDKIQIDLPAYSCEIMQGKFDKLVNAVVGSLPVEDVVLSESKNLLIRLSDKNTRLAFESFQSRDDELLSASSEVIGVIVTMETSNKDDVGDRYDFLSRYFSPWLGISEDSVTGSSHSVLAPYWAKALRKNTLYARQCSTRGGDLHLKLVEDRVVIMGDAVIVIEAQIGF